MTAEMLGLNLSTPEEFPILSLFVRLSTRATASLLTEERLFVSRHGSKITMRQRYLTRLSRRSVSHIGAKALIFRSRKV